MKIATWNVNSLNVRAPQVLEWLNTEAVDVLCVQETKIEDHKFPYTDLANMGYQAVHLGQKTYNGVAIISRHPIDEVQFDIPNLEDTQKRVVAATIQGIRIICVYIPNGQSVDSDKYQYKLNWLQALTAYLEQQLKQYPKLALLGDYNIAPEDRDVYDPERWKGSVLVSEPERAAFRQLHALGLHDSFRLFEQPEKLYSWWDYRMVAFRRNLGLRIDHILISSALVPTAKSSWIDRAPRKLERPSDHTPVILELDV
ncbi:exodeoxyribonuclease III [Alkanindiges hydrocarboniclasticus]|uniref:Exodeoxyribonuclease III n=1 Tax=Alkanindiges hydrocarboniclasticus TaxID=1907941 RepID=A0A1S8D0Q5_9GAMM|nr:exodeoxyribonuclease III [Alkanindiges hydrocarboniclasticus]ONG42316.1 exodeoxyribonuclease III [Alkanindiges hydrocarboniclasticus]